MTRTITAWLIIRNGDELRIVMRKPMLMPNEVAVQLVITAPQPPRVVATINIDLPEAPPVVAHALITEYGSTESTDNQQGARQ